MAKIRGKNLTLSLATAAGATDVIIGAAKSCTVSWSKKMIDITDKESGDNDEFLPDSGGWTISCDGFYDPAKTLNLEEVAAYAESGTAMVANCGVLGSSYPVAGQFLEGTVYIKDWELSGAIGDVATFKFSLQGTGKLDFKAYSPGGSMS